jgi:hypothetical protein
VSQENVEIAGMGLDAFNRAMDARNRAMPVEALKRI